MMNYKKFGVYTTEEDLYLFLYVDVLYVMGFKVSLKQLKLDKQSNKEVNDWLLLNLGQLEYNHTFKLQVEELSKLNLSYLGDVNDKLQNRLRSHFKYVLQEALNTKLNFNTSKVTNMNGMFKNQC